MEVFEKAMKKLDVSQLLELCREAGVDNQDVLQQQLLATLGQLAQAVARKLGVASHGVETARQGVWVGFAPLTRGDPCPSLLEAYDEDEPWNGSLRRTLLICDDDETQTLLAQQAFGSLGVQVLETHSAEEAWQVYQSREVNLVITDIVLPGENGVALLQKIAAYEAQRRQRRKVPLITISGDASVQIDQELVEQMGSVAHLTKPVNWSRLGPMIRALCYAS